ncbi:WD40 repeat domain-containing protein [Hydrogenimonas sp.]
MRYTILLLLLSSVLHCRDIAPAAVFTASGTVSDFAVEGGKLFIGTDRGVVDVFDIEKGRLLYQIPLDPVKDATGEKMAARILSVDTRNGSLLILSIGENGFRDIWIYKNFTLHKVVGGSRKLFVKEARFFGGTDVIAGTFGSRVARYGIEEGYEVFNAKASQSTMGDMVLIDGGERLVVSDEAGKIRLMETKSGRILREIPSKHLDKVHHLAYAKGVLVSGGHDRRVGIHAKEVTAYYLRTEFPVFCVGISPDAKTGLFSSGDEQVLQLFDIKSGKLTDRLVGHRALINQIKFIDSCTLLSSERGSRVLLWHICKNAQ